MDFQMDHFLIEVNPVFTQKANTVGLYSMAFLEYRHSGDRVEQWVMLERKEGGLEFCVMGIKFQFGKLRKLRG